MSSQNNPVYPGVNKSQVHLWVHFNATGQSHEFFHTKLYKCGSSKSALQWRLEHVTCWTPGFYCIALCSGSILGEKTFFGQLLELAGWGLSFLPETWLKIILRNSVIFSLWHLQHQACMFAIWEVRFSFICAA